MNILRVSCVMLAALLCCGPAHARSITKCQDKEGNWHYGDFASSACAKNAPITELDQEGMTIKKIGAPPTEKELEKEKAEKKKQHAKKERLAEQKQEDRRLLRMYDNVQDIIDARNERVDAMDRDLKSQRLFRQGLVHEKQKLEKSDGSESKIGGLDEQIKQYDNSIDALRGERRTTIEEFDRQLKRYRELTQD